MISHSTTVASCLIHRILKITYVLSKLKTDTTRNIRCKLTPDSLNHYEYAYNDILTEKLAFQVSNNSNKHLSLSLKQ